MDFIGLARYLQNDVGDEEQGLLDTGVRLYWRVDRLAFSGEWVARTAFDVDVAPGDGTRGTIAFETSSRTVGLLEYQASEDVFVTASFGKDYEVLGGDRHPLVATLGVNLHWGPKPVIRR